MAYSGANAVTTADRKPSLIARLEERFRYPTEGVLFAYRGRVDPRSGWQRPARRPSATPWRRRSVRLPALRCPGLAAPRAAPGSSASCPVDKKVRFEFLVNCESYTALSLVARVFLVINPLYLSDRTGCCKTPSGFVLSGPSRFACRSTHGSGTARMTVLDSQEAPRRQNAKP